MNPRPSWDIPLSISTSGSKRTVCVGTSATRDEPAMDYFRLESRNHSMDVLQVFSNARKMFSFPRRCKGRMCKGVKSERRHGVP